MGSPKKTVERLKRWEDDYHLSAELLRDIRDARECIEGLVADFDRTLADLEKQQQEDDEQRYG